MRVKRLLALALASLILVLAMAACSSPGDSGTGSPPPAGSSDGGGGGTDPGTSVPAGRDPYVAPAVVSELPRTETLYFGGLQWSTPAGWSPLMGNASNWVNDQGGGGSRTMMFETPFMFNGLDGKMYPLLADGDLVWNEPHTELTYKIKDAAYWSDGTKVTAYDAEATWQIKLKYTVGAQSNWTPFIEDVVALDEKTVLVKAKTTENAEGNIVPVFYLQVYTFVGQDYILQKAWLEKLVERCGGDADLDATKEAISTDPGEDVVWSGPYTKYFADDTKNVLIRDDGYWGQHPSMWGKLPTPKYLAHNIYADNDATGIAFRALEIDVNQQFFNNINDLWEKDGLPISTYIDEPPYSLCANMPTVFYNLNKPVCNELALRKAIAIATDYDAINANAVTYQSPPFSEVPRSLMNPTPGEQAMYNRDKVKHLQWAGNDVDGAKKLLDDAGIVDSDGDGWREYDGQKISLIASCPTGWNDWEATLEIVASAGQKIGIEITTNFVQESEYYDSVVIDPESTTFDIFMMWTNSISPTEPWGRIRNLLSSEWIGLRDNWSGNWGHYSNPRVDELLVLIPLEVDEAKVKDMYTELVEIYLTEVPSFSAMYRPDKFHAVSEDVWTGYTEQGDGRNVPPFNCLSGYAIADLYNLRLVG